MVARCYAKGCANSTAVNRNIAYFSLPKDTETRKQWLNFAAIVDVKSSIRLCEVHFEKSCIWKRFPRPIMHHGSIPTISTQELNTKAEKEQFTAASVETYNDFTCDEFQMEGAPTIKSDFDEHRASNPNKNQTSTPSGNIGTTPKSIRLKKQTRPIFALRSKINSLQSCRPNNKHTKKRTKEIETILGV